MDYPNLPFHVHQIFSAVEEISNHLLFLPEQHRETVSEKLQQLNAVLTELVADFDAQPGTENLAEEFGSSDQTADVTPFERTETVEFFRNYIIVDANGLFTYVSPPGFTIFGRSDQKLKGKIIWEVFPDLENGPFYTTFQEAVDTRMPAHVEMQGTDDRWFAINIHPTHEGVIIYWANITSQKQIEQALFETEERLRAALETAPINIFTLDKNLRYVWIGPHRDIFFHQPVLGKRDDEIIPAQDASILMEAEQYVIDTGKGLRKEVRFQKNDQLRIYSMAIDPLFDRSKNIVGLTIAVMDVTAQRELDEEWAEYAAQVALQRQLIEHSEQERVELARNLHDGPIQSTIGLAFSLQLVKEILEADGVDENANLTQMGDDIKSLVSELRGICNELRPPVLSRFGLHRAIQQHTEDFQAKHPQIKITLDWVDDSTLLPKTISLALYRIYQNALSNIIRHANASAVWVRIKVAPQEVFFEVQDNGQGFPGHADWSEYTRDGHFGIVGMHERAETVGGTMQLFSKPGEGTTVRVIVPWADENSEQENK